MKEERKISFNKEKRDVILAERIAKLLKDKTPLEPYRYLDCVAKPHGQINFTYHKP